MKAISLRLEESMIQDIKEISNIYNMGTSELIRKGIEMILQTKKSEAYYRLISNIPTGTEKETKEIINKLNSYTDKDLEIVDKESVEIELWLIN